MVRLFPLFVLGFTLSSCTLYQYRPPVESDSYYASRLPASIGKPVLISSTYEELVSHLKGQHKKVHNLIINEADFNHDPAFAVSNLKDYLFSLDPESDLVMISSTPTVVNKVSALCKAYGLESLYVTTDLNVKSEFLFYVSKIYILEDQNKNMEDAFKPKKIALSSIK